MKKKNILMAAGAVLSVIVVIAVVFLIIRSTMPDVKIITMALPNTSMVNEDNLRYMNEALVKDGHYYKLEVKEMPLMDEFGNNLYTGRLRQELEAGSIDLAVLGGMDLNGGNQTYEFITSGLILRLDDLLKQGRGAELYNAFPKCLWEGAKCDGHIYCIPRAPSEDVSAYVVFNRDYIADADIEKWDGSIEAVYEMVKKAEWNDNDAPRVQYLIDDYYFDTLLGCEIKNGLVFDHEKATIENPLESEKVMNYLRVFARMKKDGYITFTVASTHDDTYELKQYQREILDRLEAAHYVVAFDYWVEKDCYRKDNLTVKKAKPYQTSEIRNTIGIASGAKDPDAVLDFLCLLLKEGKYGNLLRFGREGKEYKLVDGVVCNTDGSEWWEDLAIANSMNLYLYVHPTKGDRFKTDRRAQFFAYYDNIAVSPFLGFQPETSKLNESAAVLDDFVRKCFRKGFTMEEQESIARELLMVNRYDAYLESVRSQWEEFKQ
jgi:hypothetical protein